MRAPLRRDGIAGGWCRISGAGTWPWAGRVFRTRSRRCISPPETGSGEQRRRSRDPKGESWTRSGSSTIRAAFPRKSTSTNTRRCARCSRKAAASSRTRPAFSCMGRTITFADLDALSSTFGAWLQSIGCAKGTRVALMMPNILQYPVCLFGTLRAGCTVVNVNPLYTARELEHQLDDSGATSSSSSRISRARCRRSSRRRSQPDGRDVGRRDAGVKGRVVDLVLRRVKKAVPKWSLPGAIRFTDAMKQGRKLLADARADRARRPRVPAVHRRHDRRREGRDAAASEHRREHAAGARMGAADPRRQPARGDHDAAAALSHLLADGELPRVHVGRRRERADHESARHPAASSRRCAATGSRR